MSCEVSALPFQEHTNNGTWSIDFGSCNFCYENLHFENSIVLKLIYRASWDTLFIKSFEFSILFICIEHVALIPTNTQIISRTFLFRSDASFNMAYFHNSAFHNNAF